MFPEGEKEGPVSHGRRDAVVLPRASTATCAAPSDRSRSRRSIRRCKKIVERTRPRHALRHPRRSADGLLTQGADGYQLTWMDAKVDDWVVTPRRGKAVEINALWYNALCLMERWAAEHGRSGRGRTYRDRAERASASRSTSASGTPTGGYLYDVVDGEQGGNDAEMPAEPAASRSRCRTRCSTASAGSRWCTRSRERLLTPVGLRIARAGRSRLQAALLRRPARPRRRLPPGHGLGLAGRSVRRRVAEGVSRTTRGRAPGARRVRRASRRCVHRIDQRDLRRRAAVHAARLYRPGLECGRSAALLGQAE